MSVTWWSVIWGRLVSSVAVSRVLSLRYQQYWIEEEGNKLPWQKASVLGAEMRLVCSQDQSLMVLGKSLPPATKQHSVCQKM